jgi:serine/threonine-protein kinase
MAELFLARTETELGATRLAVVKLILPAFADDPKFAEMLTHEAKLAACLSHRHIVQVLDLGKYEEPSVTVPPPAIGQPATPPEPPTMRQRLYIAMEYVEGFDLNALLRMCSQRNEGLPAEHALGIVADVLEGLDYAHRRTSESGAPLGIVHRDVSPSNVLISYEGEVKLCDFGIAHANDLVREDKSEALKGKAGYMSPEHARAEALDARADVFAAGIILWELLAGRRLYKPRAAMPLLEQARRAEIPPIVDRGLPHHHELQRIVSRALAPNRNDRYPSAAAFQRALEGYLASASLLTSRLKLGEWLASTFGTAMVEQRRASERRLPKSVPPPRSSGAIRIRTTVAPNVSVPTAPRVPPDLAIAVTPEESAPLFDPQPRAGTSMENRPLSSTHAEGAEPSELGKPKDSDEELLAWARRRGYVSFLFFFMLAVLVSIAWTLMR